MLELTFRGLPRETILSMTAQPPTDSIASPAQRVGWAIVILFTLYVCYFSQLGVVGFVGPDEPRYAWIARDMAETGDWVTPRLYGKPWFEKPPLLYWGGAIFFKLLGDQPEIAARLPSAVSALLATLVLAWLAWRTCGEECARWLLLLLPTSVGMIGFSHAAATDMPFTGMLTMAMVSAAVVLRLTPTDSTPILPRTPWLALLLFGFFLGLAVLAKGPAAIMLSGGAVFFWALLRKRWRDAFRLLHPVALASFSVTALPWYILCAWRNPDFFRIFIVEHNLKRFLTLEFQHIQPFWYYLPVLLIAFLPWSPLVSTAGVIGFWRLWRTRRTTELTCLMLAWAGFCLLFFTVSKSKLPGYILPSIPAVAFLLAKMLSDRTLVTRRTAGTAILISGFFYLAATIYYFHLQALAKLSGLPEHRLSYQQLTIAFLVSLLFLTISIWVGASFWARSNSAIEFSLIAAGMVLALGSFLRATPAVVELTHLDLLSGKALALAYRAHHRVSEPLRLFGFRRDYRYALNFYLHEEVPDWTNEPVRNGYVLSEGSNCAQLKTPDQCVDLWDGYDRNVSWGLLKITTANSLDGLGSGRKPQ
jgi:4-amino-4-deoxy-L-arabinose transferase-like glycosyltransferase